MSLSFFLEILLKSLPLILLLFSLLDELVTEIIMIMIINFTSPAIIATFSLFYSIYDFYFDKKLSLSKDLYGAVYSN